LYALLARNFLLGKTSLPIEPRPELLALPDPYNPVANGDYRLHDASLYGGHYYLYFGAVPAVVLFAPYRLVTGKDFPNRAAVPIFCIGGYLCSCALFFLLARHNRWELPFWLQCAVVVSLCSMSLVALVLRRPSFYEVACSAGYFFVMAGFLALARALFAAGAGHRWLLLAGLMFGMSVGCRPHLVVVCGIVLTAYAFRQRREPTLVISLAALMVATGIALGWYNYARFGNPLEFGVTYQLGDFTSSPHNVDTALHTAYEFLFLKPRIDANPPFFHTVYVNVLPGNDPANWTESTVGLIAAAPFALVGFFAPLFLGSRRFSRGVLDEASRWLLFLMYGSGLAVFLVLCIAGWVLGRYFLDFAPLMTFAGTFVLVMLWQTFRERAGKGILRWALSAAAVWGAVLNASLATPRLDLIAAYLHR
jgi:hypothetical protein